MAPAIGKLGVSPTPLRRMCAHVPDDPTEFSRRASRAHGPAGRLGWARAASPPSESRRSGRNDSAPRWAGMPPSPPSTKNPSHYSCPNWKRGVFVAAALRAAAPAAASRPPSAQRGATPCGASRLGRAPLHRPHASLHSTSRGSTRYAPLRSAWLRSTCCLLRLPAIQPAPWRRHGGGAWRDVARRRACWRPTHPALPSFQRLSHDNRQIGCMSQHTPDVRAAKRLGSQSAQV